MEIILIAITMLLYAYLGYKLKKNPLKWAFIGFGVLLSIPLVCSPFLLINVNPSSMLLFWTMVNISSFVVGLWLAVYIAYKNNLIIKRMSGL